MFDVQGRTTSPTTRRFRRALSTGYSFKQKQFLNIPLTLLLRQPPQRIRAFGMGYGQTHTQLVGARLREERYSRDKTVNWDSLTTDFRDHSLKPTPITTRRRSGASSWV